MKIRFAECPDCYGYGVRDSGINCKTCGGKGSGGLHSGNIGSGEIMRDAETGKIITPREYEKYIRGESGK